MEKDCIRKFKIRVAVTALFAVACSGAEGNDTNAVMAAGGLSFARSDAIRMDAEDLFISPHEVRVAYEFSNLTDRDETLTVAFPIPDIDMARMSLTPHEFHASSHDGDIFNFRLIVNGAPAVAAFQARAIGPDGKDVTKLLASHGIPLVDRGDEYVSRAIEKLPSIAVRELEAAGVLDDSYEHITTWVVKGAYSWKQTFPARQTVKIEHVYEPVLGGTHLSKGDFDRADYNRYCPDKDFARAAEKHLRDEFDGAEVTWIEYILKTGANWAGPIGRFHLELAKGDADILSLCPIPGLTLQRKDRSFVAEARAFMPQSNIKILYVYRGKPHRLRNP